MINAMPTPAAYQAFLGTWILMPQTCDYEQGDPPVSGRYVISEHEGRLRFVIEWTDADGASHRHEFSGKPDGSREPFSGGDLADCLATRAVSPRELTTYGYYQGRECMVAQRQLDDSGQAMRVTQLVRLDEGSTFANVAIYRRYLVH